ncbi:hypothetical protein BDV93DRAFT_546302 [Ceratobasidium sp. AG-I]|nr:hypothetical protein BDV93DRAFT_546302 [Ceratobasidium sp. AG-I]
MDPSRSRAPVQGVAHAMKLNASTFQLHRRRRTEKRLCPFWSACEYENCARAKSYCGDILCGPNSYQRILDRSITECRVHKSDLRQYKSASLTKRMFRRGGPYQSQIREAYRFVVENYKLGDDVILAPLEAARLVRNRRTQRPELCCHWTARNSSERRKNYRRPGKRPTEQEDTDKAANQSSMCKMLILIFCSFTLRASEVRDFKASQISAVDRALCYPPSSIENLLCMRLNKAFVVQRGAYNQIIRERSKAWLSKDEIWYASMDWLVELVRTSAKDTPTTATEHNDPFELYEAPPRGAL